MNKKIEIKASQNLSEYWFTLNKVVYNYQNANGKWETHTREVYDRGNGACVLLYNKKKKTVILTKQFRLPTYLNGNESGMLIEVCAGAMDSDNPEECIRREIMEETGYNITKVEQVLESYMSPGAVTEIIYFFIAEYDETMKISDGGGLQEEEEHIEVLEINFDNAFDMISKGEIKDGKTIMLLQYAKINNLV
jgi:nudix-type nucleoside diphosphatase (YffH/AdpP family)